MSLKSIEMQIALPRTIDATKLQEELLQKGQHDHSHALLKQHKEDVNQRTTVVKQEQKDHAAFRQNGGKNDGQYSQQQKQPKKNAQKAKEKHPYKGNFLDFSG